MAIASRKSGARAGAGKREIDASGLVVAPGWVDVHTHSTARSLGSVPDAVVMARRDDAGDGQLRRRFRTEPTDAPSAG
jgi:imidazolonepropionase-like amidohydrolase